MKHILLPALLLTAGALNAQLFTEDFEGYNVGDYIAIEGAPQWATWTAGNEGDVMDAQITDEAALSGTKSLKIFGDVLAGGPMDVVLWAGLDGAYEVTFNMFIPSGSSGYYNFQGLTTTESWVFDCYLNGDSSMVFSIQQVPVFTTSYTPSEWLKVTHYIDTDSDLMHVHLNDEYVAQLPYAGPQIGGINFYAAGDGINFPLYYVDDIVVDVTDPVVDNVQVVTPLDCTFGPNPAQDFVRVQANLENALVRVLALDGKVVLEERRNDLVGGAQLNLDLDNGIYLLELTNGSQRMTQRLVIQK